MLVTLFNRRHCLLAAGLVAGALAPIWAVLLFRSGSHGAAIARGGLVVAQSVLPWHLGGGQLFGAIWRWILPG